VTQVSWDDAIAFCKWLNDVGASALPPGWRFRLPTEAEWEKAARGSDGRLWPWGDTEPGDTYCNFNLNVKDTTPVGQYSPKGDSPYGCVDMAGNVWEWCLDEWDEKAYSKRKGEIKDPCDMKYQTARVLRGGSFFHNRRNVRCAYRDRDNPYYRRGNNGIRLSVSPMHL